MKPSHDSIDPIAPGLAHLCDEWAGQIDRLLTLDDEELYWNIESAIKARYSTEIWSASSRPELAIVATRILDRLSEGWFAKKTLTSPQFRYSLDQLIGEIAVGNGDPGKAGGEKPTGGLWTSSVLPSGRATWERAESRFRHLNRPLLSIHFIEEESLVHIIHSPDDFASLIDQFPIVNQNGSARVDWVAASRKFDAVHLTARGLLLTDGVTVTTPQGVAELSGWSVESTVWLNRPPGMRVARMDKT